MKICSHCKNTKTLDSFHKNGEKYLQSWCKQCHAESQPAYKAANRKTLALKQGEYRRRNPDVIGAINANRRAAKLQRTPPWLTKEHKAEIKQIYKDAKLVQQLTQTPMSVDHIVPLQGENVSGLHVPWNMQIITVSENSSKNNRCA